MINDLIDLVRTANETYLLNPLRNARSAYIQIDDICELSMKSWLIINVARWSSNQPGGGFKNFNDIATEIRGHFPTNAQLHDVLGRVERRRTNRNQFFHNPRQAGLTVDDENCLNAFLDLFGLLEHLFRADYTQNLNTNAAVKAQIVVIKLKRRSHQARLADREYGNYLGGLESILLQHNNAGYELFALYEDAERFLLGVQAYFQEKISKIEAEIARIDNLRRPNSFHHQAKTKLNAELDSLQNIYLECLL